MFDVCIRKSARCRSSAGRGNNGNISEIMLITFVSNELVLLTWIQAYQFMNLRFV